ncbi:MAG: hypothetical protein AB7F49_04385 [Pseudorhodoplanes sp.]
MPHDLEDGAARFRHKQPDRFGKTNTVGSRPFCRRRRMIVESPLEKLSNDDLADLRRCEWIVRQQAEMDFNRFLGQPVTHRPVRERLRSQQCEFEKDPLRLIWIEQTDLEARAAVASVGQAVEHMLCQRGRIRVREISRLKPCQIRKIFNQLCAARRSAGAHSVDQQFDGGKSQIAHVHALRRLGGDVQHSFVVFGPLQGRNQGQSSQMAGQARRSIGGNETLVGHGRIRFVCGSPLQALRSATFDALFPW